MGRKISAFDELDGADVSRSFDYLPIIDASEVDASKNKRIFVEELRAALTGAATDLGSTGTVSLDPTISEVFTTTPSGDMTINAASGLVGRVSIIVTTSGTTSRTLTFGTHFKTTGTLATGAVTAKVFTISFVGDGTNLNETSRTAAM